MDKFPIGSVEVEGQWRQCPKCMNQVSVHQKFCSECGTQIEGLTSSEKGALKLIPPESEIFSQASKYQAPSFNIADLFPYQRVSRSLRELYFDLGLALIRDQKYSQSIEAFQYALDETGTIPQEAETMLWLAYGHEMLGDKTKALRCYLVAVLQAPRYISAVLPHVHDLIPADMDLDLGEWVLNEWAIAIEMKATDAHARMHVAMLLGQIEFYLAHYHLALKHFQEAMQWDPEEASTMGAVLLLPERLPNSFKMPIIKEDSGYAEYILAQLYYVLGYPKEALYRVNHAFELGIKGTSDYPETSALLLKAQLLEKTGDAVGAASRFYEAGRRFSWLNDFERAIELLSKAKKLNPRHVKTYWSLANALRMGSYVAGEPPYVDKEKIDRSLEIWEEGRKISLPETSDSWAYVVRALINQGLAMLATENQQRQDLFWGALLYLECALLMHQKDPFRWALLGRYYRILNLEACALAATQKGVEYDEWDPTALDERAAILANVGKFSEAEKLIDRRRGLEPSVWADGVKAFILVHTKRAREALDLVDKLIAVSPREFSYRGLRALCYQELAQQSSVRKDYQFIWDCYNPSNMNNNSPFGWAAYKLGKIDQAIEIFSTLHNDRTQARSSVLWNLGMFYLVKGELTLAESYLEQGTEAATNIRQLDDVVHFDFPELEKIVSDKPYSLQVSEVLARTKGKIDLRKEQLSQNVSVEEDLRQVISQSPTTKPEAIGSPAWIAVQAGIARLYIESKRYTDAAAIYQHLQTYTEMFPEVQRGLKTIAACVADDKERVPEDTSPRL